MAVSVERQARVEITVGGQEMTFETGKLAKQADGAVVARAGDTMVLATAQGRMEAREGADFFPLTVDVEERMYAAGKIPGGFFKREGRPSERAILTARMIDRPIRPLWPKGFKNDVQIIVSAWSSDQENDYDTLAVNAASAALTISSCAPASASRSISSGTSSAPASTIVKPSFVPTTTKSSLLSFSTSVSVGLTVSSSSIRPTRTAPIGPRKGSGEIISAADAPLMQRMSCAVIRSAERIVQMTCTSFR